MPIPVKILSSTGKTLAFDNEGRLEVTISPLDDDVATHSSQNLQSTLLQSILEKIDTMIDLLDKIYKKINFW